MNLNALTAAGYALQDYQKAQQQALVNQQNQQAQQAYLAAQQQAQALNQYKLQEAQQAEADRQRALAAHARNLVTDAQQSVQIPGTMPMGYVPPQSNQQPAPAPGQASMPAQPPVAQPQQVRGGAPQQAAPPQPAPYSAALPNAQAAQAQPQQMAPPKLSDGGAMQPQHAESIYQSTQQILSTPTAQRIASDPNVSLAQQRLNKFAAGLDPNNITPDQRAQLTDLESSLSTASAEAAKNAGVDSQNARALGQQFASLTSANIRATATLQAAQIGASSRIKAAGMRNQGAIGSNAEWQAQNAATYTALTGKQPTGYVLKTLGLMDPETYKQTLLTGTANAGVAKAIKDQSTAYANIEANFNTLESNYKTILMPLVNKVNSNTRIANMTLGARIAMGDPDASALRQALVSIRPEAAQLLQSGGAKLGGSTVHALEQVASATPETITPAQIQRAFEILQGEGHNRLNAIKAEIDKNKAALAKSVGANASGAQAGDIPTINNQKSYDALPKGAQYYGPDGQLYTKG